MIGYLDDYLLMACLNEIKQIITKIITKKKNKEMMKFNIELSKANLTKLLEHVNLKTYNGGFAFIRCSTIHLMCICLEMK